MEELLRKLRIYQHNILLENQSANYVHEDMVRQIQQFVLNPSERGQQKLALEAVQTACVVSNTTLAEDLLSIGEHVADAVFVKPATKVNEKQYIYTTDELQSIVNMRVEDQVGVLMNQQNNRIQKVQFQNDQEMGFDKLQESIRKQRESLPLFTTVFEPVSPAAKIVESNAQSLRTFESGADTALVQDYPKNARDSYFGALQTQMLKDEENKQQPAPFRAYVNKIKEQEQSHVMPTQEQEVEIAVKPADFSREDIEQQNDILRAFQEMQKQNGEEPIDLNVMSEVLKLSDQQNLSSDSLFTLCFQDIEQLPNDHQQLKAQMWRMAQRNKQLKLENQHIKDEYAIFKQQVIEEQRQLEELAAMHE